MNKLKTAIIPAAGRGKRMLSVTDNFPKAMIPYKGKPIIGHQIDWLIKNGYNNLFIVTSYRKEKIIDYVSREYSHLINLNFVEQENLNGLSSAILDALNSFDNSTMNSEQFLVLLSDVLPLEDLDDTYDNYICTSVIEDDDISRWCLVSTDDDGNIVEFYDKPEYKMLTRKNIVGLYGFTDFNKMKHFLNMQMWTFGGLIKNELQFSYALDKYNKEIGLKSYRYDNFLDFGEYDKLSAAKKNQTRHFNSIEIVDCEDGTKKVIKKSKDIEKMMNERNWLCHSPIAKEFGPKILGEPEPYLYEMEFIESHPMQELYCFGILNEQQWLQFFDQLTSLFSKELFFHYAPDEKSSEEFVLLKKDEMKEMNEAILIEKTINRLEKVKEMFPLEKYTINGKIYKNPALNMTNIINKLKSISSNTKYYGTIHGDLFFGNMMYDKNKKKLNVFDPRGNYGLKGGSKNPQYYKFIGDVRYDAAKMNHSINGYYDFIINGLYILEKNGSIIRYQFYDGDSQEMVKKMFDQFLLKMEFDKDEIELITGILFLSMIPLHSENKNNQIMQFCKACEFLSKFI